MILAVKKLSLTKVADAAGTVSGLISLVLLVTLVTLGFTKQGLEHKFSMINTTYGELEMSTDQNLVLLVLDTVDGDIMSQVIEHHPEYKETLSDFTYSPANGMRIRKTLSNMQRESIGKLLSLMIWKPEDTAWECMRRKLTVWKKACSGLKI